jgi:monoamine oxidase
LCYPPHPWNNLQDQTKQVDDFYKKVVLNCEVSKINYSSKPVKVHCKSGAVYEAASVIVTVSLGVLKEQANQLFAPQLPFEKLNAIKVNIGKTNLSCN